MEIEVKTIGHRKSMHKSCPFFVLQEELEPSSVSPNVPWWSFIRNRSFSTKLKKTRDLWRITKLWAVILGERFGARGDQFHYQLGSCSEPQNLPKSQGRQSRWLFGDANAIPTRHLTWMLHDYTYTKYQPGTPNNQELKWMFIDLQPFLM